MGFWGDLKKAIDQQAEQSAGRNVSALHIQPSRSREQDVVGESYYSDSLRAVVQKLGGTGEHSTMAVLIPEPENVHDNKAIAVYVEGHKVGHIPRDETSDYHVLMQQAGTLGHETVAFDARVWCEDVEADDLFASISLTVPIEIALALSVNEPDRNSPVWPVGGVVQVTKEADYLPAISDILRVSNFAGICSAFLVLQSIQNEKAKWTVDVFYADAKIGELSAANSTRFGPVIARLPGQRVQAEAEIRGNSIAAEVILLMKSPESLSSEEISALGL